MQEVKAPHSPTTAGDNLFVLSGCSSSGKSTLLEALAKHGEAVSVEPGRLIVKQQLRLSGDGLPWLNRQRFIDLCAAHAIREFDRHVSQPGRVFFDRGFVDVASAAELTGMVEPDSLRQALQSRRYAPRVFMSPPWEALFLQDDQRRHTFRDAVAEYDMLVPTYRRHGYEIVFLPQVSVPERVSFVRSTVAKG